MADENCNNNETEKVNPMEESTITMLDVLEQEKELEEEYAAVLGASDEKCCTYSQGAVKRQALYSCLTCCPEAKNDLAKCAGICLACSYRCHENHDLVELYTKRNFRCDCPTERFGNNRCLLNAELTKPASKNMENVYNHNFQGLYCTCKRPYPDPERTTEEVMLQCSVCEDWYHIHHMNVPAVASRLVDSCCEMICESCMKEHSFLQYYTGLALKVIEQETSTDHVNVSENGVFVVDEDVKDLKDVNGVDVDEAGHSKTLKNKDENETEDEDKNKEPEPETKKRRLEPDNCDRSQCKKPPKRNYKQGKTKFYKEFQIYFIKYDNYEQLRETINI